MIKAGVIRNSQQVGLKNKEVYPFLLKLMDVMSEEEKNVYHKFLSRSLIVDDYQNTIQYFVQVLGYTIIINKTVYFPEGSSVIDKAAYLKAGYHLEALSEQVYENGKFHKYQSKIQKAIEKLGFEHSASDENYLSFWYPKTKNLGFKTPDTISIDFTEEESDLIKRDLFGQLSEQSILERVYQKREKLNLEGELFLRLDGFSNKFNFESCHLTSLDELYPKLLISLNDCWDKLEWQKVNGFALREFIKAKNPRKTIYHGLPLNTEFRVFYDFDTDKVLGIYNYWDKDRSFENLKEKEDLFNYLEEFETLEEEFYTLWPLLEEKVSERFKKGNLKGQWSVDFLYDGQDFILIDMAHAECSYYYEKVLERNPQLIKEYQ